MRNSLRAEHSRHVGQRVLRDHFVLDTRTGAVMIDPRGDVWARRLATGLPINEPVALVVAHPDDETLWAGAAFARLDHATLVVVTDGAPEDMADARRLGFETRAAYAATRSAELEAAVGALGGVSRLIRYGFPDQGTASRIAAIAECLVADCAGVAAILTHPYEGGHPDHDSVALAVRLAADRLEVPVVEFACYARFDGTRMFARFVDDPSCPAYCRSLDPDDGRRIERALQAHASQSSVFGEWRPETEQWRAAPQYDFTRPPPGEAVLYDEFGWSITGTRWRLLTHQAAAATASR